MKFAPRWRALIDVIGYLVIFFPIMIVLIFASFDMAKEAYQIQEVSQFSPWQPVLWPFKSMIFIGFSLLLLQGVAEFIRSTSMVIWEEEL